MIRDNFLSMRMARHPRPNLALEPEQHEERRAVLAKIQDGAYEFKEQNCPSCNMRQFERLSRRDQYGLPTEMCICEECGLVQINPRMLTQGYADFYEHHYRVLYSGQRQAIASFYQGQLELGRRMHGDIAGMVDMSGIRTVVEVGCGAGLKLPRLDDSSENTKKEF